MKTAFLFGKWYVWVRVEGVLTLVPTSGFENVPQRYAMGPPSFEDLEAELGRIEATGR
jgi:hypothetical protein